MRTVTVNIFGGPGAGKTTAAWEIAAQLKKQGHVVEYVAEYAKELIWDGREDLLVGTAQNQRALWEEQTRRIDRLVGKVDFIVTDSPPLLGALYLIDPAERESAKLVDEMLRDYQQRDNFTFVVERGEVFEDAGRIHNKEQSENLDRSIVRFLEDNHIYKGVYTHHSIEQAIENMQTTHERLNREPERTSEALGRDIDTYSPMKEHERVIRDFLTELNRASEDFVLKGGTALRIGYGLDRFSEDIDLDGRGGRIQQHVETFCEENDYSYRVAKDTEAVERYMIRYDTDERPLKVEVSYRQAEIEPGSIRSIDGIRLYDIDTIAEQKCEAFVGRDKLRDLYDLAFVVNNHHEQLDANSIAEIKQAIGSKGIEQLDYLWDSQQDMLIDIERLADGVLDMHERLGLDGDVVDLGEFLDLGETNSIDLDLDI